MFKVLHTGDLHLGSAFSGLPIRESERRRAQQLDAFHRLTAIAAEESVSLFLIAGDLFDSSTPPASVTEAVFDALASLACPVVIAPGNHDPYRTDSPYAADVLPENVYVFSSPLLSRFSFPEIGSGVEVFGYAFTESSLAVSPIAAMPDNSCLGDGISILLAHGDLDQPLSRYAPIPRSDIARSGADYVALGHVHNIPSDFETCGDSIVSYCGFLEGRSFDECGFGSFVLLTFDEAETSLHPLKEARRVPFSAHRYAVEELDITGASDHGETVSRIRTFLSEKGYGNETALRLSLVGDVALRYAPDPDLLRTAFAGERDPAPIEITDRTLPILDAAYLEADPTIRGELYRVLKPKMLSGTPEERADAASALRIAFAALDGRAIL